MASDQNNETMRPIPDGGLKDNMPNWLKRKPSWRDMPTPEQRHERSLPEPDTSEIDPHSLVDVSDLPQWLQGIAARGPVVAPDPDPVQQHAVSVLQQAHATEKHAPAEQRGFTATPEPVVDTEERVTDTPVAPDAVSTVNELTPEATAEDGDSTPISDPVPDVEAASASVVADTVPESAALTSVASETGPVAPEAVPSRNVLMTPGIIVAAFVLAGILIILLLNM